MTEKSQKSKILVTGGSGYIGSHTCKALFNKGFVPVVIDKKLTGNAERLGCGILIKGDIRNTELLRETFMQFNPVAVLHFAAEITVSESVENPGKYYSNNTAGALNVLNIMREFGCKNFIFSSTAAVYGEPETVPIKEDTPKYPINPYGHSKLMIEQMLADFRHAYNFKTVAFRYFNAAGADPEGVLAPAQTNTHILPLLLDTAAGKREGFTICGTDYPTPDGTAVRDYIHVTDLANAHVLALEHILAGKESLTLNLGTNTGTSVQQVVDMAQEITGKTINVTKGGRRAGDPPKLIADATQAQKILNWKPEYSDLKTILQTAWKWYQN